MLRARDLVAHIDVVGPHPRGEQPLHQPLHHIGIVVHPLQQDGLAAERDARVGEPGERLDGGGGELVGMIEVRVDVQWVVPLEDRAQLRRDALRQVARDAAPDAYDLDMRDSAQPPAELVDPPVGQEERIAAGHDHVADFGVLFQVPEGRLELRHGDLLGIAHLAAARAEAAVRSAHGRYEEQRAVGIAMRDVGNRRVGVLGE